MTDPKKFSRLSALCAVAALTLTGCTLPSPSAAEDLVTWDGERVRVELNGGTAEITPNSLAVEFVASDGGRHTWSAPADTPLGDATEPRVDNGAITWRWPDADLNVTVTEALGRATITLATESERSITWPVSGTDATTRSLEFPNGEGQSIPVDDAFWNADDSGLVGSSWDFAGGLTMPFWGATYDDSGVSYLVDSDIGTSLEFDSDRGRLTAAATHQFDHDRGTGTYAITLAPTDGTVLAAALDYRSQLIERDELVSLERKIAANPETEKLLGALHAYTWGDGRDPSIIASLQQLGVERAWLGYDADGAPMSADTVASAAQAGYLVAPYDTWDNAQDPADADTESSIWPGDIWPNGCVHDAQGEPVTGFGGRGCYVSTAALDAAEASSGALSDRVSEFTTNGATSYFLDVDAVGQLFRDYTPEHPQTEAEDRDRRAARLDALANGEYSSGSPLVLGSETVASWANGSVSYSHGSSTPLADAIWSFQQDREQWGGYWPQERPGFFFKPTELPDALAQAMFDPAYRVPLYQAVLHDSVISTDRWEIGLYKFPDLVDQRILMNLLTNTPAAIALDQRVLDEHGEQIAAMQRIFGQLQAAAGTEPLTAFERVADSVQRTTFGDAALVVTANFGEQPVDGIAGGCLLATVPGKPDLSYCP